MTDSHKTRRGALAVELLLAMPILLAVIFATVQFSMLLSARQQVTCAAREGARVAALGGSPTDIATVVERFLGPTADVQATLTHTDGTPVQPGEPLAVVVSQPVSAQVPNLLSIIGFSTEGKSISSRAVMIRE